MFTAKSPLSVGPLLASMALCVAAHPQNVPAPTPPLEQVPLSAKMASAASLGTVSSLAVDREGRLLRSWGRGMFTVPHSVRVDPDGNIWTVDAGSSVVLKFSPQGK